MCHRYVRQYAGCGCRYQNTSVHHCDAAKARVPRRVCEIVEQQVTQMDERGSSICRDCLGRLGGSCVKLFDEILVEEDKTGQGNRRRSSM